MANKSWFIAQELQTLSRNENDILDLVYDVNPKRIEANMVI